MLLAYATMQDLEIDQMDVDSAFLQADLNKMVYIKQPEGFIHKNSPILKNNNKHNQGQMHQGSQHKNKPSHKETAKESNTIFCSSCTHPGHTADKCFTHLQDLDKANIAMAGGIIMFAINYLQHAALITRNMHKKTIDENNLNTHSHHLTL